MLLHKFGYGEKVELKKLKNLLDHMLLLFNFEKKYFDKENITNTFVGHPLLKKIKIKTDLIINIKDKKIISFFQVVEI